MPEPVKVLYIAGTLRSGSTLLGRLLGELPSAVNVGELGVLFLPQFRERGRCECRQPIMHCDFWQAVFERAFGGMPESEWQALQDTKNLYRMRSLPRLLLAEKTASPDSRLQDYVQALDALYSAVREVSGARVIADSSKDPLYSYLLQRAPSVDLRTVHLVRDSRAVAFSNQRIKTEPPLFANPLTLPVVSPLRTAVNWNLVNGLLSARRMGRYFSLLRYEDVVQDPPAALSQLWEWMDEPPPPLDFLGSACISLRPGHSVAGNPDRFDATVRIRQDDEWQRKMKQSQRVLVTALTLPLLLRYGYLRPQSLSAGPQRIQPKRVL